MFAIRDFINREYVNAFGFPVVGYEVIREGRRIEVIAQFPVYMHRSASPFMQSKEAADVFLAQCQSGEAGL